MIGRKNVWSPFFPDHWLFCYLGSLGDLLIPKGFPLTHYQQLAVGSFFYHHLLAQGQLFNLIELSVMSNRMVVPYRPLRPDAQNLVQVDSFRDRAMQIFLAHWLDHELFVVNSPKKVLGWGTGTSLKGT